MVVWHIKYLLHKYFLRFSKIYFLRRFSLTLMCDVRILIRKKHLSLEIFDHVDWIYINSKNRGVLKIASILKSDYFQENLNIDFLKKVTSHLYENNKKQKSLLHFPKYFENVEVLLSSKVRISPESKILVQNITPFDSSL